MICIDCGAARSLSVLARQPGMSPGPKALLYGDRRNVDEEVYRPKPDRD